MRKIILIMILSSSLSFAQLQFPPDFEAVNRDSISYKSNNTCLGMRVEIGDTLKQGFEFGKWDDECLLRVCLLKASSNPSYSVINKQVLVSYNGSQHRLYNLNNGFEWEIVFSSKPKSNIFKYAVEMTNLAAYYQPPITGKDTLNHFRPDSVIDSYAIYHSSKSGNNYKTGKFCHIFRPRAWDNKDTVWCDILIDHDTLILTVPQAFLGSATYPVTVDPTIGYSSCGESELNPGTDCHANTQDTYTAVANDTITQYHAYITGEGGDHQFNMSAYTVSGSNPSSQLQTEVAVTGNGDEPFQISSQAVTHGLTASTECCVAITYVSGNSSRVMFDSGNEGISSTDECSGDLPASWSEASEGDQRLSIWADVSQPAGGAVYRRIKLLKLLGN